MEVLSVEIDEQELLVDAKGADAVVTFSPVLERLRNRGMVEVFSSRQIPGEIVDVLAVDPHIIEEHGDKLLRVADAWFDALDYIETERQRSAELMAPRLGMTPVEVLESLEQLELPVLDKNSDYLSGETPRLASTLRKLNRLMIDVGFLEDEVDVADLMSDAVVLSLSGRGER